MRTTELLARLRLDPSQFDRSLQQSQTNLNAFGRAATALPGGQGNIFGALARDADGVAPVLTSLPLSIAAVGASLTALGVTARRAGVDFEASLAKIATLGPESQQALGATRQAILDTYNTVPIAGGVRDLAEANYLLQSSGRSATEAITDLDVAAKASVAGYASVTTAVDGLTTVTNAWKESQISTQRASDVLFTTVNVGKATFEDIASQIGLVAPIAANAGVRFEEIAAATAVLSNQGIRTSSVMEGLRSAISNIIKPTEGFRKEYAGLAAEFGASRLARDGLLQFLRDFDRASGGSQQALRALFSDVTGFTAVLGLMKNGGADAAAALKQMDGAAGATQRALDTVNKTAAAQEQLMRNQISAAWTQFGELISRTTLPILASLARMLNSVTRNATFASRDVAAVLQSAGTTAVGGTGEREQLRNVQRVVTQLQNNPEQFVKAIGTDDLDKLAAELQRLRREGTLGIPASLITTLREERSRRDAQPVADAYRDFIAGNADAARVAQLEKEEKDAAEKAAREAAAKDAADRAARAAADAKRERERIVRDAAQLTAQLEEQSAAAVNTVGDALRRTVEQTIAKAQALIDSGVLSPAQVQALNAQLATVTALQEQAIVAADAMEGTRRVIQEAGREDGLQAAQRIGNRERELMLVLQTTTNLEARKRIEEQLEQLATARGESTGDVFALPDGNAIRNTTREMGDLAQSIATVADQLGLLPRASVDALRGIGALAEQGSRLQAALKSGSGVGALGKVGIGIGVAAGIASLAAALFSETPEDRQKRADLRANTEAIRTLTLRVGDLSTSTVSGSAISRIEGALANPLQFLTRGVIGNMGRLDATGDIARAARVTEEEVRSLAQTLGITLNDTFDSVLKFAEALRTSDLNAYTNTFAGSLQRFEDSLRADGVTDPVTQFTRRVATLTDARTGFPALADALAGLDLSTVEGRSEGLLRARSLFERIQSGGVGTAEFGGLTFSEARTQTLGIIEGLRALSTGGESGTGGFGVNRSITEVTGNRVAGLLGSANTYLAQIAADVRAFAVALQLPVTPGIGAPALPAGFGRSAGGGVTITGGITVHITLPAALLGAGAGALIDQATALGQATAAVVAEELDRQLLQRERRRRLFNGDASLVS